MQKASSERAIIVDCSVFETVDISEFNEDGLTKTDFNQPSFLWEKVDELTPHFEMENQFEKVKKLVGDEGFRRISTLEKVKLRLSCVCSQTEALSMKQYRLKGIQSWTNRVFMEDYNQYILCRSDERHYKVRMVFGDDIRDPTMVKDHKNNPYGFRLAFSSTLDSEAFPIEQKGFVENRYGTFVLSIDDHNEVQITQKDCWFTNIKIQRNLAMAYDILYSIENHCAYLVRSIADYLIFEAETFVTEIEDLNKKLLHFEEYTIQLLQLNCEARESIRDKVDQIGEKFKELIRDFTTYVDRVEVLRSGFIKIILNIMEECTTKREIEQSWRNKILSPSSTSSSVQVVGCMMGKRRIKRLHKETKPPQKNKALKLAKKAVRFITPNTQEVVDSANQDSKSNDPLIQTSEANARTPESKKKEGFLAADSPIEYEEESAARIILETMKSDGQIAVEYEVPNLYCTSIGNCDRYDDRLSCSSSCTYSTSDKNYAVAVKCNVYEFPWKSEEFKYVFGDSYQRAEDLLKNKVGEKTKNGVIMWYNQMVQWVIDVST